MLKFHVLTLAELARGVCVCVGVCVCDNVALPFTLNKGSLRRQKKNYGNSKYFTMQKYNPSKNML